MLFPFFRFGRRVLRDPRARNPANEQRTPPKNFLRHFAGRALNQNQNAMATTGGNFYDFIQSIFGPLGLARLPFSLPIISLSFPLILTFIVKNWVANDEAIDLITNPESLSGLCGLPSLITYDFIVVGGGTAGMVVATRLANNSNGYSVLLLEAGGEPSPVNDFPSLGLYLMNQPSNCWIYPSERQEYAGLNGDNQGVMTTRGKMLGGSGQINFLMHVRGNKEDYNRWANELGDQGWNYESVLPYFKMSENYEGYWPYNSTYHGKDGLLNVASATFQLGLDEFLAAAQEKGYPLGDYNGENQEVFSPVEINTKRGFRHSLYKAYYKDTGKSPNLTIKKYALVQKIKFNNYGRAVGVVYERHGCTRTILGKREIILSAGTFGSAQLLMLSGIGPKEHLESLQIPVKMDLPVGETVQDHPYTLVGPFLKSPGMDPNRDFTAQMAISMFVDGSGPLASPGMAGTAFFTSPVASPHYPDLQMSQAALHLYKELPRDIHSLTGQNETLLTQWWGDWVGQDVRLVLLWLGRPKSVGHIRLRSRDPRDAPINDPKYLSEPEDVEALLYGVKKVVDLYENSAALNAPLITTPIPGCEGFEFKSDDYYRCGIRRVTASLFHHVGSCGMGRVVDTELRVFGVEGLRVIDASVMVRLPNGNTNAPTVMIAEKGVEFIRKTWSLY